MVFSSTIHAAFITAALTNTLRPPNLFQGRRVQPGQFIHASVIEFMHRHPAYKPAAELNNGLTWEDFRNVQFNGPPTSKASSVIVQDLYSSATDIIPALQDFTRPHTTADPEILRRGTTSLRALASSGQQLAHG